MLDKQELQQVRDTKIGELLRKYAVPTDARPQASAALADLPHVELFAGKPITVD